MREQIRRLATGSMVVVAAAACTPESELDTGTVADTAAGGSETRKDEGMREQIRRLATGSMVVVAAAACTPESELDTGTVADTAAAHDNTLPPEVVAQLVAEYPRLGEEPLPEPQPNGAADPSSVPAGLPAEVLERATGEATFYANKFEGRRTASGVPFRQNQMVAAHRAYPFGTVLRVTNTRNNRAVNVRVVDRGPFGSSERARRTIIDLSTRAAGQLGFIDAGRAPVRVEVLEWGQGLQG